MARIGAVGGAALTATVGGWVCCAVSVGGVAALTMDPVGLRFTRPRGTVAVLRWDALVSEPSCSTRPLRRTDVTVRSYAPFCQGLRTYNVPGLHVEACNPLEAYQRVLASARASGLMLDPAPAGRTDGATHGMRPANVGRAATGRVAPTGWSPSPVERSDSPAN